MLLGRGSSRATLVSMALAEPTAVIARRQTDLEAEDAALAAKTLVTLMRNSQATGDRIEVRDFGAFELRRYAAGAARNPKTGKLLSLPSVIGSTSQRARRCVNRSIRRWPRTMATETLRYSRHGKQSGGPAATSGSSPWRCCFCSAASGSSASPGWP